MKTMNASEFKAKCLAILDEVEKTGEPVTIIKRGRAVAQLVPPVPRKHIYPQRDLIGSVNILGDVVEPVLSEEAWEALRSHRRRRFSTPTSCSTGSALIPACRGDNPLSVSDITLWEVATLVSLGRIKLSLSPASLP